jgi:hypothetical protein
LWLGVSPELSSFLKVEFGAKNAKHAKTAKGNKQE